MCTEVLVNEWNVSPQINISSHIAGRFEINKEISISKSSHIERGFEIKKNIYTLLIRHPINAKKGFYQSKSITSFKNQLSQGEFFYKYKNRWKITLRTYFNHAAS